jgi:hypothetical protein
VVISDIMNGMKAQSDIRFLLRMPPELAASVATESKKMGKSMNQTICELLSNRHVASIENSLTPVGQVREGNVERPVIASPHKSKQSACPYCGQTKGMKDYGNMFFCADCFRRFPKA